MISKGFLSLALSALYVLGTVLAAGAAPAGSLSQVIEGAKKEGTLTLTLRSNMTPKSMERLEKEIGEKFGVDLKMKFVPSNDMRTLMTEAVMEDKVGAKPSYDLLYFGDMFVPMAMKEGILERVDWKPLITKDTNPKVVLEHPQLRGVLAFVASHVGLMYNPDKIKESEVPKTLAELANPKWKGRVGLFTYEQTWARWFFILGREKVLADLKSVLKNGAVRGRYIDLQNRYLLTEIWLNVTASNYLQQAQEKGMPAVWQNLDFSDTREYVLAVRKGATHPNAAKLVSLYLASPAGAKYMLDESGAGTMFYPGNLEQDISRQAEKRGIPEYALGSYPGLVEFHVSDQYKKWSKEIRLLFDTVK